MPSCDGLDEGNEINCAQDVQRWRVEGIDCDLRIQFRRYVPLRGCAPFNDDDAAGKCDDTVPGGTHVKARAWTELHVCQDATAATDGNAIGGTGTDRRKSKPVEGVVPAVLIDGSDVGRAGKDRTVGWTAAVAQEMHHAGAVGRAQRHSGIGIVSDMNELIDSRSCCTSGFRSAARCRVRNGP